jgi:hypothetical protein
MRKLIRPLWVVLAVAFLVEAWLWDHLKPVVARIVDFVPWDRLKAHLAARIETLSPTATLAVFLVPLVVLCPIKLLEFGLLAHRRWVSAIIVLVLTKMIGLGVTAFIFDVTRQTLLQIPWFHRLYTTVMWLRDWAHGIVDPIKQRMKQWLRVFAPGRSGRAFRLLMRIRRRMHAPAAL